MRRTRQLFSQVTDVLDSRPRVAFYAPSTGSANGHCIESIVPELSIACELLLVVPEHFKGCREHAPAIRFRSAGNKVRSGLREINLVGANKLFRQILHWKPDVVHLFNGEGYPWTIYLAAKLRKAGVPVLLTIHDPEAHPKELIDKVVATLRQLTYRFATAFHLFSHMLEDRLPAVVRAKPIFFVPHWTVEGLFLRYKQSGIKRDNTILFFGRILPYKGLNTLVKATVQLEGRFKTVIAGKGDLDPESKRIIDEHPDWFDVRGRYVPDSEIAVLLQSASICALPYTHVTQSSVPMIAAAFEVPVVASRLGGFIEDVSQENGCLIPPNDPGAFATAVLDAVHKKPRPLSSRALSTTASQLKEIYQQLKNNLNLRVGEELVSK